MACITGDEVGLIKVWGARSSAVGLNPLVHHSGLERQSRDRAVAGMCWVDDETTKALAVRENGTVVAITRDPKLEWGWSIRAVSTQMTVPVRSGLFVRTLDSTPRLISCSEAGYVEIRKIPDEWFDTTAGPGDPAYAPKSTSDPKGEEFRVPAPVEGFHVQRDRCAFGGKDRPVEVWDINKGQRLWTARKEALDFLGLPRPLYITAVRFLLPEQENIVVAATGFQEVLLYDLRTKARRVHSASVYKQHEAKFNVIETLGTHIPGCVAVGDTQGNVMLFDPREDYKAQGHTTRLLGRCKPSHCGAIRSIAVHPTQPVVASVCLGRWLMFHDILTRELISKVYIKQKGFCCVIAADAVFPDHFLIKPTKAKATVDDIWETLPLAPVRKRKGKADAPAAEGDPSSAEHADGSLAEDAQWSASREADQDACGDPEEAQPGEAPHAGEKRLRKKRRRVSSKDGPPSSGGA
eukprot:RCo034219